jgi:hypothetical protein
MSTETTLREALAAEGGALGVPDDPWPGFVRRERTHRRNRRIRIAAVAAAVVAAVGVQSGVVPLPGWAPGIAVAGRETALAKSPLRGSLAADEAWLEGMRREIKDVEDPGELWRITDRSKIRFLYAADVPGHRLVLALVPLRFGFLEDQALIWYEGRPGAAPAEMEEGGREDGGRTVSTFQQGSTQEPGVLVVVAPNGSTVSVSSGFSYSPEGRVEHAVPQIASPGSGIAEFTVPAAPFDPGTTVTVTAADGRNLYRGPVSGSWTGPFGTELSDTAMTALLGRRRFDPVTLGRWVRSALSDARLPAAGTSIKVRWTGAVDGRPAAMFTLQPRGGGVLAYAFHGAADSYRQDLRLLLPAAGVDDRPIAWRMRAEGKDDRTDQVVVVPPPGAVRLLLGGAPDTSGAVFTMPDESGAMFTTLPPSAKVDVTAYAADGEPMGTTPIPPFETDSGGIPGDDRKTRVVD